MPRPDAKRLASILAFPAFVAAILVFSLVWSDRLWMLFRSAESVRVWVAGRGAAAPLAFVALQILQVVVFVIPGEVVQIAGGYAFGFAGGILWSSVGILAGSLVNFWIGRMFGRPFVLALFGPERTARIEAATSGGTVAGGGVAAGFFLVFAIPGLPKDALTYVAGASRLPFVAFLLVSTLGRMPGIAASAWMGSAAWERDYVGAMVVFGIATVLFFLGLIFQKRLLAGIGTLASRFRKPRGG